MQQFFDKFSRSYIMLNYNPYSLVLLTLSLFTLGLGALNAAILNPPHVAGRTIFVANGGTDSNDGLTWETAKGSIQGAVLARDPVDFVDIRVKEGVYAGFGSISVVAAFETNSLNSELIFLGGYPASATGTDVSGYDPVNHPTVLTGNYSSLTNRSLKSFLYGGVRVSGADAISQNLGLMTNGTGQYQDIVAEHSDVLYGAFTTPNSNASAHLENITFNGCTNNGNNTAGCFISSNINNLTAVNLSSTGCLERCFNITSPTGNLEIDGLSMCATNPGNFTVEDIVIRNMVVTDCLSSVTGGGLNISSVTGEILIEDSSVVNSLAVLTVRLGRTSGNSSASIDINNCFFGNNKTNSILILTQGNSSSVDIRNSLFYGNVGSSRSTDLDSNTFDGPGFNIMDSGNATKVVDNCIFEGNRLIYNPGLVNPEVILTREMLEQ